MRCKNFYYKDDELLCDGLKIKKIVQEYSTPVFIYSELHIRENLNQINKVINGKQITVCYAVKANPALNILKLAGTENLGFDVVSEGEMRRVLASSPGQKKIVFSGVGKTDEEIRFALQNEVFCLNVESLPELNRVNMVAKSLNVRAPVSIRINPDVNPDTHPYIATGLRENKFGLSIDDGMIAYKTAQSLPFIDVKGIDCHIGSQILSLEPFEQATNKVLNFIDRLIKETGVVLSHINLGGGLGISYSDKEHPPSLENFLSLTSDIVINWYNKRGLNPPHLLFELGRSIVGNSGILVAKVLYLKSTMDSNGKNFAVVDAAMNDLVRPTLYNAHHEVVPVILNKKTRSSIWEIVGPICESGDWLAKNRELRLLEGDLISFLSAGAYCSSMASNYNSRRKPVEVMVNCDGSVREIVRRESYDEIFNREIT
ncbi:diaminopimelate decarboxylase [Betaproteobacteria bacterium]|nr:diaminopimelate decarboxylase [Betaproteobacteria bacterium]